MTAPIDSRLNMVVRSPTPFGLGRNGCWPFRESQLPRALPFFPGELPGFWGSMVFRHAPTSLGKGRVINSNNNNKSNDVTRSPFLYNLGVGIRCGKFQLLRDSIKEKVIKKFFICLLIQFIKMLDIFLLCPRLDQLSKK